MTNLIAAGQTVRADGRTDIVIIIIIYWRG